ncbi:MAG TPA: hypothetical protein VF832_15170 [Longimicrobiales bacterium]
MVSDARVARDEGQGGGQPGIAFRLAAALAAGLAAGLCAMLFYRGRPLSVSDFDSIWVGARALRAHQDPYAAIQSPPWPWDLRYPLPAVLVSLPLTYLSLALARATLVAVGVGFFAWGLTRRAWWPLIALASGQVFVAVQSVQWTPLLAAGLLIAPLQMLWSIKPTTGLALFAAEPSRSAVLGGVALLVLAFLVWPHWLDGFLAAAHRAPHRAAVLRPGGVLLLLGLLRWRSPEGRLLATLALMPLTPHLYEAVPLLLVARSRRELLGLAACGTLGLLAVALLPQGADPDHGPIAWLEILIACYLPALVIVLRHANVSVALLSPLEPVRAASSSSRAAA